MTVSGGCYAYGRLYHCHVLFGRRYDEKIIKRTSVEVAWFPSQAVGRGNDHDKNCSGIHGNRHGQRDVAILMPALTHAIPPVGFASQLCSKRPIFGPSSKEYSKHCQVGVYSDRLHMVDGLPLCQLVILNGPGAVGYLMIKRAMAIVPAREKPITVLREYDGINIYK